MSLDTRKWRHTLGRAFEEQISNGCTLSARTGPHLPLRLPLLFRLCAKRTGQTFDDDQSLTCAAFVVYLFSHPSLHILSQMRSSVEPQQACLGTWNLPTDATTPLASIAQVNETGRSVVGAVGQPATGERACRLHRDQASTDRLWRANRLYYHCNVLPLSGAVRHPKSGAKAPGKRPRM